MTEPFCQVRDNRLAERDEAREALRPFAELADTLRDDLPDNHPMLHGVDDCGLDVGHFRRARQALQDSKP